MTARRATRLAAAALVGAVVAGCGSQVANTSHRVVPRDAATPPPPAGGMQRVWFHGVTADVPESWPHDATQCGIPTADTVIVTTTDGATPACLIRHKPGLSVVWLGGYRDPLPDHAALGEAVLDSDWMQTYDATSVDGEQVRETTEQTRDHRQLRLVVFPRRHAFVSIASPDEAVVAQVRESLHVTSVDPQTGCPAHSTQYDDPQHDLDQGGDRLLPGTPARASACLYVDGWLERTAVVRGEALDRLVTALRAAPAPTGERSPEDDGCENVSYPSPSPAALLFDYADSSQWTVVATPQWCTRWQSTVSSGAVTRRMTGDIERAIPVWEAVPDPDSLDGP